MIYSEEKSILIKYIDHIQNINPKYIETASIQEGASILSGKSIEGIDISFLDLSTNTKTGTFKDHLACITIAYCLENRIKHFVCCTSGNTGNSLSLYASANKINATIFYPKSSRYKIDPKWANSDYVKFIEVDGPELLVRKIGEKYSELSKLPLLPNYENQIEANKIRAYFLWDYVRSTNNYFDWHVQALSGGYGAFGFYKGLEEINSKKFHYCPRIFGVQQKLASPYYNHLYEKEKPLNNTQDDLIEPTLYKSQLDHHLLDKMKLLCSHTKGVMSQVDFDTYQLYEPKILKLFSSNNLKVGYINSENKKRIIEKSGILATAGIINQIKLKKIQVETSPLVVITGGLVADRDYIFEPQWKISSFADLWRKKKDLLLIQN